jgi:hypothetical protein
MNSVFNAMYRWSQRRQGISWKSATQCPSHQRPPVHETLDDRWMLTAVPAFTVQDFDPTDSGFVVAFSDDISTDELNLYDVEAETFGPADVAFVGDSVGRVRGSLVMEADRATFIATGGPLPADTYTVTLRSGENGFQTVAGQQLDGNRDGTPGDDYVETFTVGGLQPIVVSLPDFARGPGQPVTIPAYETGLPITLTDNRVDGYDVETVDLKIQYNPDLLTITAALAGPDAPGADVDFITSHGSLELTVTSLPPLPSGPAEIVMLTAEVPAAAGYGAAHVLDVENLSINGGAIDATADDAQHTVDYLGDTTGNGSYSGLDVQRLTRVVVELDAGFRAFPTIDPRIIGDITGNGSLSGLDLQRVTKVIVGMDVEEIPPLPDTLRLERLSGTGSGSDGLGGSQQSPNVAAATGPNDSVAPTEAAVLDEPTFEIVYLPGNDPGAARNNTVQTGAGGGGQDPFDVPIVWEDEVSDNSAEDVVPIENLAENDLLDAGIVDQAFASLGSGEPHANS